jgi:predicted DNA-binding transcriptional regulator AlpA
MPSAQKSDSFEDRRVISEAEAARYGCLSLVHFRRLRRERQGPQYVRITDRRIGYRRKDLTDWIEQRLCS